MPKTLLAAGALACGLLAGSAVAKDSEADTQLREALRQKMSELESNPAKPPTQTPAEVPAVPAPAPASASPTRTAPTATATVPAATAPAATPTGAVEAPTLMEDPETAKLRDALRQRLDQETANPTPVVQSAPAPVAAKSAAPGKPQAADYPTMTAPALPISGSKQQRLQQLLEQYKADRITPSEYHAQRAKIIAE